MTADNFSKWCDGLFKIFATLAIVVGGGWAVFEYEEAKQAKRIERSMHYVNSLETEKVNQAISFISAFWSKYKWGMPEGEERRKEIVRIVNDEPQYQDNLKIVLNYLDEISFCVEHSICDSTIVLKTKKGLFLAGFANHFPWVISHRKKTGHPKYFKHLECFVDSQIVELKGDSGCRT